MTLFPILEDKTYQNKYIKLLNSIMKLPQTSPITISKIHS